MMEEKQDTTEDNTGMSNLGRIVPLSWIILCSRCHQIFLWFACIHDICSDCVVSLKIAYHIWLGSFEFSFLVHHGVIIMYLFVRDDSLTG